MSRANRTSRFIMNTCVCACARVCVWTGKGHNVLDDRCLDDNDEEQKLLYRRRSLLLTISKTNASNPYRYESRVEKKKKRKNNNNAKKNDTKEGILISVQVIYPSGKHLSEWYALYTDNSETKNSLVRYCTLITNALLFKGLDFFFSFFVSSKIRKKIFLLD